MDNFLENHLNILKKKNFSSPEIDLRTLLKHSLKNEGEIFFSNFNFDKIDLKKFNLMFKRRINNEPISKIVKKKEFWSYDFYVNNYVLDPRPETEFIIETVRKYFLDINKNLKIADLGTGSGCLAITLAKIYKQSKILATDISFNALKVAKKNSKHHNVYKQISFSKCNWINSIKDIDIFVSNPPYISNKSYQKIDIGIKSFEPQIALRAGIDGLEAFRQIARILTPLMSQDAYFFLEIGYKQKLEVVKIFGKYGIEVVEIVKDYQFIERVLVLKKIKRNIK